MPVQILYFAQIRDTIGLAQEWVDPPSSVLDISALADWLAQRSPGHAAALADRRKVRVAVDQVMADFETPIQHASEIAFFPPVTGG